MRNQRKTRFMLSILAGLILGLALGWFAFPAAPRSTTLASLRSDYQADYILMVAENFAVDRDVPAALVSLQKLGATTPQISIKQARIMGQQLGFTDHEQQLLSDLEEGIGNTVSTPEDTP